MGTTNPLGSVTSSTSLATYCLLLPRKQLHLSALLFELKFRGWGSKTAALEALHELEAAGLRKLEKEKSHRRTAALSISSWFTFQCCCSLGFIISGVHPTSPSLLTIVSCMGLPSSSAATLLRDVRGGYIYPSWLDREQKCPTWWDFLGLSWVSREHPEYPGILNVRSDLHD